MATITSPSPMLFSVLSTSHDHSDDFVNQLRNHLAQIETNLQQTLNQIQQRQPFTSVISNANPIDEKIKQDFLHVLKDVAITNKLPFNEPFFREQMLGNNESSPSPNLDVVRAKPPLTNDQHLSPVNNTRRSQFAPVLSSTPVHQLSPIMPIPVDLTMATSLVAAAFTMNSTDLPAHPPSAIVPQRANLTSTAANRPPRIPRGESVSRQKKNLSVIKDEIIVTDELRQTSKRRIRTNTETVDDTVRVIIERQSAVIPETIKSVQATPLRGRKKKIHEEDVHQIPQLEPPPPLDQEVQPKTVRTGRSKKKNANIAPATTHQQTRTSSIRQRNKQEEEKEVILVKEATPSPPKKTTRNRKKTGYPTEENVPIAKSRATPARGKKKSSIEISEPVIPLSPKKTKKRKENPPLDAIQPPSPKRRGGRQMKSIDLSSPLTTITPPALEQEPSAVSTRSSRRAKKDIEEPVEKQNDIVLKTKSRTGRGKKLNEPINTDIPLTVVDVVITSVAVSAPIPSSMSMDSLVAKPPRPPVARKKRSIAMLPIPQMSPSTPPSSSQRIQSTSPINDKPILRIPAVSRRRQPQRRAATSPTRTDATLEVLPSMQRNQKRTQSSVATTPKRARRENLVIANVPGTPGKKRNKCTCEKRRNKTCDICETAIDG